MSDPYISTDWSCSVAERIPGDHLPATNKVYVLAEITANLVDVEKYVPSGVEV